MSTPPKPTSKIIHNSERDTDPPPLNYIAGRWRPRDGNVYGPRYTYEANAADAAGLDFWMRRSPPARE